ncbi:hypothetical protein [Oceanobacillus halophilus]|uniref:hypothetical protein n=1 Tax=Oceanobacillus halophilus TaxID=930130 RepID=UPI00131423A2|nr:hypothetical protein [Oceanobacillus halophilus]
MQMNEQEKIAFNNMLNKLKQQEKTIAQLVEIIAVTNRRITDLSQKLPDTNHKQYLAK